MATPSSKKKAAGSEMPPILYAHASVHSAGGTSLFNAGKVTSYNVNAFFSETSLMQAAVQKLKKAGFSILWVNGITISIGAAPEVYEQAFNVRLETYEKPTVKELGKESTSTCIRAGEGNIPGLIETKHTSFRDVLEGVAINEPVYFMESPIPPTQKYWHLNVPADVSLALNADPVHRMGFTGRNINVVMADSGWYRHPYFVRRGYRAAPVVLGPATTNPANDDSGHGTGESANLFATAPDINFRMVKMNFVDSAGAFSKAVSLNPHIISCSWGSDNRTGPLSANDMVLSASVANAVARGIVVVFAAGNGQWGFPGQHPDVISAGGVYMNEQMQLQASNYASGFASNIFPGRKVPDVSGLVGMLPRASYIMLPVQPGDQIDTQMAGGVFPNGDHTLANDGWAAFSGTSAAAPQIAGICALLKQVNPALSPLQIKNILKASATDVTTGAGSNNTGANRAATGPDLATGHGLVNAAKAVYMAMNPPTPAFGFNPYSY
ncbi:MAG: S8 family serine peptidase [Dinghuibacter sp.]|nr:S8 family serine peptidase [Dinghuibacter sp.]